MDYDKPVRNGALWISHPDILQFALFDNDMKTAIKIGVIGVIGLMLLVIGIWKGNVGSPNLMQTLMLTPVKFYGIVLDQDGQPVPAAKVEVSVLNNFTKGTPISTTSDASGKFIIRSRGASLHVEVSKQGYGRIDRESKFKPSSQGFDFVDGIGKGIHHPDSASPVVFQLRKPRNPVALERLAVNPSVPRDGTPITVNLSKTSTAAVQIRCLTNEGNPVPMGRYNWRCETSVKGGGIQEVKEDEVFEAPEDGYASSAVIEMPTTLDVKVWRSRVEKKYWLRFPDNTYGRVEFSMHSGGDHFAIIEGYRNPASNDRNLESKIEER